MPNRHAVSHPSVDSSVANTQRHPTHPELFCKGVGLHYTRLHDHLQSGLQTQIGKQRISSKPSPASRPKSTQYYLHKPQAAEVGLASRRERRGAWWILSKFLFSTQRRWRWRQRIYWRTNWEWHLDSRFRRRWWNHSIRERRSRRDRSHSFRLTPWLTGIQQSNGGLYNEHDQWPLVRRVNCCFSTAFCCYSVSWPNECGRLYRDFPSHCCR